MVKIVFKLGQYPEISETFITNQIISAINLGYQIEILVNKKNSIAHSSQKDILEGYGLLNITSEYDIRIPQSKVKRFIKALYLVIRGTPLKFLKTFNYFKYKKVGLYGSLFYYLVALRPFLDADIFHIQFGINAFPLDMLKHYNLIQGRLITTFHGFDAHFTSENLKERQKQYYRLFSCGSCFTVNTEYLKNKLIKLGCPAHKVHIVPMGVNTKVFKPNGRHNADDGIYRLISVGRLVKLKGFEFGIRAVKLLIEKNYNVQYTIIGDGQEYENLKKLIYKHNLQKSIFLLGFKDQNYILKEMQKSDLYLMTSTYDETGRREAQGIVSAEAQACGLPVCAFKSGGVEYTVKDRETGMFAKENNYKELAENIELLLVDQSMKTKMSIQARIFIEKQYSLDVSSYKMNKVYQEVLP